MASTYSELVRSAREHVAESKLLSADKKYKALRSALALLEEAETICRPAELVSIQQIQGVVLGLQHDYSKSHALLDRLALVKAYDRRALLLVERADLWLLGGDTTEASKDLERARSLMLRIGERTDAAVISTKLARVMLEQYDRATAMRLFKEAARALRGGPPDLELNTIRQWWRAQPLRLTLLLRVIKLTWCVHVW